MCRQEKQEIRRQIRRIRSQLPAGEKAALDQKIFRRLLAVIQQMEPSVLYCYVSMKEETDTRQLLRELWNRSIRVAVPRVEGDGMYFCEVRSMEELQPGSMGILEPLRSCPVVKEPEAAVITPGAAFSVSGQRIGFGGGYYDRFFAAEPQHQRIAAAYPFQVFDTLPSEVFDQRVHTIVTSEAVIDCIRKTS